jgi:hypothetical protein
MVRDCDMRIRQNESYVEGSKLNEPWQLRQSTLAELATDLLNAGK